VPIPSPGARWKWGVCGVLLLASAINYLDRQTLSNAAVRIGSEFKLSHEQYGNLELGFGWAFAAGSLIFGLLADRVSVRWLYPAVVVVWSCMGFATGLVQNYPELLLCRVGLGLAEAGHWPCALKTTQWLLEPKDRTMGNSVLQSGTSIGAVLTPLIMSVMLTQEIGSWRAPFQVIGATGVIWVIVWFAVVSRTSLRPPADADLQVRYFSGPNSLWRLLLSRRFLALIAMIVMINTSWQLLRAWLPKFLQEGRGYTETEALYFNSLYYIATDIGCLGAGAATLWLNARGRSVHRARSIVYILCACCAALTSVVPLLPRGPMLLGILLVIGAGALGVFPCYYAFSQELSTVQQGAVTGLTGVCAWIISAPMHKLLGRVVDTTGSFDLGIALTGWAPLLGLIFFSMLWGPTITNAPISSRD
jgi:MFS transporter, ACS family, hexuronate transporter